MLIQLSHLCWSSLCIPVSGDQRLSAPVDLVYLFAGEPDELLKIHRAEDSDTSLWTIFNRVQEGIIRGGVKGRSIETGRNFTSKPINAIDANFSLNKELWSTVRMMADFKTSALAIAA